jgi:RHS repeat-associated protein
MGAARSVLDLDECVPTRRSRPAWNRTKYIYDAIGRLIEEKDLGAAGNGTTAVTDLSYNSFDRVIAKVQEFIAADGSVQIQDNSTFAYEPQLDAIRLTSANNGVEQLSFNYEALPPFQNLGYGVQATDSRNSLSLIQGQYTVTRDITSEIASIQDQSGHTLFNATYDPAARLLSMASGNLFGNTNPVFGFFGQPTSPSLTTQIAYDTFGRRSKIAHSTGLSGALSYDELNRPTEIAWDQAGQGFLNRNSTPFASEALTYDPAGNITESNQLFGRIQYGYDSINQLTSVSIQDNFSLFPGVDGSSFKSRFARDFTYDPSGNRIGDSLVGPAQYVDDQIVSNAQSTFTSDSNGFGSLATQTDLPGWMKNQFSYRPDGKLSIFQRSIAVGRQPAWDGSDHNVANVTYYFDALGRRVAKAFQMGQGFAGTQSYTQTFSYLVDKNKILLGRAGNSSLTLYLDGKGIDEHLGEVSQGMSIGFATDHLGSVLNSDVAGIIHGYGPFGETLPGWTPALAWDADPVLYGYAGRQYDRESGQYYNRSRMYSSALGRFTTKDPIGLKGGINLYRYTNNNPLQYNDPDGECGAYVLLGIVAIAGVEWYAWTTNPTDNPAAPNPDEVYGPPEPPMMKAAPDDTASSANGSTASANGSTSSTNGSANGSDDSAEPEIPGTDSPTAGPNSTEANPPIEPPEISGP